MLLSVGDKLDHYQILGWCHYGDDIRRLTTQNDSQHAGSTRRTLTERKSSMPFISPNTTFGAQGQSVIEASLLIFPKTFYWGQIIESVNYAHENGIDKKRFESGSGRCSLRPERKKAHPRSRWGFFVCAGPS